MAHTSDLSNPALAALIHVSPTYASRLRNGLRDPSDAIKVQIRDVFGWSLDDQVQAILDDTYGEKFSEQIERYLARTEVKV